MSVDKQFIALTCCFFSFLLAGCGGENLPEGMPRLYPCSITITQSGKPLEGAVVGLYATAASGVTWMSGGVTDARGIAGILTQGQFKGAPAGTYKVTVRKEEIVSLATPEQLAALEKAKADNPKWYDPPKIKMETWQLVEKKYTDKQSTTLELAISRGASSESFEVGNPVREKLEVLAE